MTDTLFQIPNGNQVRLGYKRRAFEPKSVRYNFSNYVRTDGVDLTQPRFFWGAAPDPRLPILNQKQRGTCSSFGAGDAATEAERMQGQDAVELLHNWLYEQACKKEGTWAPPADPGSDPADILGQCMIGAPPESIQADGYTDDPNATFDQYTPQATLQYVKSFHAIYPTDSPNLQTLVWQSLNVGYPVVIATLWTNAMFDPIHGILPNNQLPSQEVGGHCIRCFGIVPGYFLCDNQWGTDWAADATLSGFPNMRPGSFAIPWSYGAPNSLIEVAYSVVGVSSVAPTPTPTPDPKPQPTIITINGPETLTVGQTADYSYTMTPPAPFGAHAYWYLNDKAGSVPSPVLSATFGGAGICQIGVVITDALDVEIAGTAINVTVNAASGTDAFWKYLVDEGNFCLGQPESIRSGQAGIVRGVLNSFYPNGADVHGY